MDFPKNGQKSAKNPKNPKNRPKIDARSKLFTMQNAKKYRKITFSEKSLFLVFFWEFFCQAFFYSKNFFGIFGFFRKMVKNRPKNGPKNHENFKIISVNKGTQFFKNRDFLDFSKKVF